MSEALFIEAVEALGGEPTSEAWAALVQAYAEGERAYHDLAHVETTLATARLLAGDPGPHVILALLYHDAVYDPRAKDNEARSAVLARSSLASLGLREEDLAEIERLILVTRDHISFDAASVLVVDADLAILAAPPEEYDRYAAAIRREYAFVPDADYRVGRTRVLEGLLARERLFSSSRLDENAARANLRQEIAVLNA